MKITCAWCKCHIGYKEGVGESHGICPDCLKVFHEKLDRIKEEK